MPRYFFDIYKGGDVVDQQGTHLAGLAEAKQEAANLSAGLLRGDLAQFWKGKEWTVRVSDERRLTLFEITFLGSFAPTLAGSAAGS